MEFGFSEKEEKLRKEIREFAKRELPPGWLSFLVYSEESSDEAWELGKSISKKLAQRGWLTMAWPKEYGGQDASIVEQFVYKEEIAYWGIPGVDMGVGGVSWICPSIMLFGSEEQKKKYLPLTASGEEDGTWCTAYSEPNAGSDMANMQTSAVREGDHYIINGQKVWTSGAHRASWCWLAVRTDPHATKKHRGISTFVVNMKSPGITVRPLLTLAGIHIINEIFFDNVRVPAFNLIGEENRGWYQLMASLSYERSALAAILFGGRRIVDELIKYVNGYEVQLLSKNPIIRQKLADRVIEVETIRLLLYHIAWMQTKGLQPIHEASEASVFGDELMQKLAITGMEILGLYCQVKEGSKWAKFKGEIEKLYLFFPGMNILGGTDEIERNIIAQFGLGLPRGY
jgi:alkylation response protein AidB-like acyl-CoA dehydrogenase